ncbi:hypothetical protein BDU57DRAFT_448927 [Ampelomyces quisqualis]|uniref:Transmembrane protein n=1 Tax=Ampelomyces quisqualis TaxID=50730 RepID=A0A6A5QK37_AMPQU|nr:hypothetical protein BDU57DRAFT_448927 [Ampelomyces quisqualis]
MGAGMKVVMGLRFLALSAALAIVGLGVWSKLIMHDVKIRGDAVLRKIQLDELESQQWRAFFVAATNGTTRTWISIAAASIAFVTCLLVVISQCLRRLAMPGCVRVPLELLSTCAMVTAFGCTLSFALSIFDYTRMEINTTNSAELNMFTIILPLSRGLVVTTGAGSFILIATTVAAMLQGCMHASAKESCAFEPTASGLGMGHEYQAIVPLPAGSRPPTIYDPRKPLPKQLDGMPQTEEESNLAEEIAQPKRADSAMSQSIEYSIDMEKEETWPLNLENSEQVRIIRPSRPWSEIKKGSVGHAL